MLSPSPVRSLRRTGLNPAASSSNASVLPGARLHRRNMFVIPFINIEIPKKER
jgi:hypothetical protein